MDLSTKRARSQLAERREPYWQRLAEGAYLGFRRGPDTWLARFRGRDGKQQFKPLGESLEFDEAKGRADEWLAQLSGSPVRTAKRDTVRAALDTYLADLRRHGRQDAAKEAEGRFKLVIHSDSIAELGLESATRDDFEEWRDRFTEGRQPRSLNRHVRTVIAGLNRARQLGHVGNEAAWKLTPLSDDVDDEGDTAVFLTADQRKAIITAASQPMAEFLRGLELTGARPNELAATTAGDFDGQALRLAHRKGRPPKLRVRHFVLGSDGAEFFASQARRKLPGTLLFTEDGEQQWRRHVWAREFRAAANKANTELRSLARIPLEASAYSFRHARISELLQLHEVDPLTVASQTGTSLAVIEKTYFKFIASAMREKLAQVKA